MNGAAAMLQAARDGDVAAVERLLSDDPRLVRASDEHLKTPLHWAAEHDRRDVAEMLLDAGADLERHPGASRRSTGRQPWGARRLRICS
jgi:ankyrin repeat protein